MALTNEVVNTFLKEKGKNKCVQYIYESDTRSHKPNIKSYEYSLNKLCNAILQFEKSKSRPVSKLKYDSYLQEIFQLPQVHVQKQIPKVTTVDSLNLKDTVMKEKQKNKQLTESMVQMEEHKQKINNELKAKSKTLDNVRLKLKRTSARETYALSKIQKVETNANSEYNEEQEARVKYLEEELEKKKTEIWELQQSCDYLQDLLNDNSPVDKTLDVFDEKSRRYTQEFKQCVYELLQNNVSAAKVSSVVNSVLSLANIKANKLPSKPTILEMNLQRLCLSQKQLSEVFSQERNTTLLTDETSKFGTKYMGYEATDSDGNFWVLGLREIETKSSDNTLNVFKQILSDIDEKSSKTENEVSRDILCHISSTMSDRAATEVRFNDLLEKFRKEILPLAYCQFDTFTEEERASIETLSNFFCGLHALVNFAETSQKCLKEVESSIFDGNIPTCDPQFKKESEPGTCRLVRTAAKAFGEGSHGDKKIGCQGSFTVFIHDFLAEHGLKHVPLRSYRGSRFNILFSNAASVFFLHENMLQYLECNGAENRLLKSVMFDLKTPEFVAGLKALGLVSTFITCPLWLVLEDKSVSITDMNNKYLELVTYLGDAANNIDEFMNGNMLLFGDRVQKDKVYHSLLQQRDFDQTVHTFLEVILGALCQLGSKLYKDYLVRTKPNLSTLAAEACVMFVNNKTLQWLSSKDELERNALIKSASTGVSVLRSKFKERIHEIERNRQAALSEKIAKRENLERERVRKQELYTNNIVHHGLWQSEHEIDNMTKSYATTKDKIEALKAQLKFRKEVLHQIPEVKGSGSFNFYYT